MSVRTSVRRASALVMTTAMLVAGGAAVSPASAGSGTASGTRSLAAVLAADGSGFDRNPFDYDIVDNAVGAVLAANPDSPIAKFLEKKGEGIHHIAFDVEDIVAEIARLKAEGFTVLNERPKKGADNKFVAFLHPKGTNGVLVELCQEIQE